MGASNSQRNKKKYTWKEVIEFILRGASMMLQAGALFTAVGTYISKLYIHGELRTIIEDDVEKKTEHAVGVTISVAIAWLAVEGFVTAVRIFKIGMRLEKINLLITVFLIVDIVSVGLFTVGTLVSGNLMAGVAPEWKDYAEQYKEARDVAEALKNDEPESEYYYPDEDPTTSTDDIELAYIGATATYAFITAAAIMNFLTMALLFSLGVFMVFILVYMWYEKNQKGIIRTDNTEVLLEKE